MPFVRRNAQGQIIAIYAEPTETATEELAPTDPQVADFLKQSELFQSVFSEWLESDLALARVLEDLIDILIEKNVLVFTDFPDAAQRKLLQRRGLRSQFSYVDTLFTEEDAQYSMAPGDDDLL